MSKQKHTPEPWKATPSISSTALDRIRDNHPEAEAIFTPSPPFVFGETSIFCVGPNAKANAARIVACVNHCKGATNEELNAKSHADLIDQRDNLIVVATMLKHMVIDQSVGYKLQHKLITDAIEMLKSAIGDTVVKDRNKNKEEQP